MATTRENLEEWAYDWANNEDIPQHAMDLFLDEAEKALNTDPGIASESLGDHSVSYHDQVLTRVALQYLVKYRQMYADD